MFVLMSKNAAAAKSAPPPVNSAIQPSSRTQNACDPCRIRKSKCDGHTPCGRCQAKQIVCTSSRRFAKASGPVTVEHVAILQEQQRRLTRAVSNMAEIIKLAESRGFSEDGSLPTRPTGPELSGFGLSEVLQRFAPENQMPETSPVDDTALPSKKRRFQEDAPLEQQAEDMCMDDFAPAQASNEKYEPFQKFLTTIQQHHGGGLNPTASTFQPALAGVEAQQLQAMPTTEPQNMPYAGPMGSSNFEFDPQLAPFVNMIDWDASLEHFLDSQYAGDTCSPYWDPINTDVGMQNGTS